MSRKAMLSLTAIMTCGLLVCGCAPSAKLAMNFTPNQTVSYESTYQMIKDVEFEQPSLNKDKKDQTSTMIAVKFDQTVTEVTADGTATVDVTIKGIQCKMVNKNEVRYDFDSASDKSKSDALNNMIGQSYRIAISPDGSVKVVDAAKARAVTVTGPGQKIAQNMVSDESIIERHQLPLPQEGKNAIAAKQSWTQVKDSPPGLLAPKKFNKVYTLDQLSDSSAVVSMTAKENLTEKPQGEVSSGNMGFLAKLFDNTDEYTGKLVINPAAGIVDTYEEKLISSYTAQDKPKDAAADVAPDTLVMRLTYSLTLKKID